jgi:predicted GNAT superfamily acetyltransferase
MKEKLAVFMTLVTAVEEAELLCTIVLDNGTAVQVGLFHLKRCYHLFAWAFEVNQTASSKAY